MTSKKSKKESTLYYFYSSGCAFCKKIDPIVEQLNKDGYDILRLDLSEKGNQGLKNEIQQKYNKQCGTPWLIDASNGNHICGWKDEESIKKWADGEEIPEPPQPKGPPPKLPENFDNEEEVDVWKGEYEKWREENNHLPNVPNTDSMLENLLKRKEMMEKQTNMNPLELKLNSLEEKIDRLMRHLGVR